MKVLSFLFRARTALPVFIVLAAPLAAESFLPWDFLWAGSWEEGGRLAGRGDLKLRFTGPGLTLRGEILDRREGEWAALWPFEGAGKEGETRLLGALYHQATGSRLLYGSLEEWGLGARLRNPWIRGLPFAESRKASMADLRSAFSTREDEFYLYLGSPYLSLPGPEGEGRRFPGLRAFASLKMDPEKFSGATSFAPLGKGNALGGGLEGWFAPGVSLSMEGFSNAGEIPAGDSSPWFLKSPPLPDRDFRILGFGLSFNSPYFALGADAAWSNLSIYGGEFPENIYANLGIRMGNKGAGRKRSYWQLSLAADGAGPRYTGIDGAGPGAGFRAGGKLEWQIAGAGFFRINTGLSGSGFTQNSEGELQLNFDRSSSGFYYRPPAGTLPIRLSRISLTASRDAREAENIKDSATLGIGAAGSPRNIAWNAAQSLARLTGTAPLEPVIPPGTLSLGLSGTIAGTPKDDHGGDPAWNGRAQPWPLPGGPYLFDSLKAGFDLSWSRSVDLPAGAALLLNGSPRQGSGQAPPRQGNVQIKAAFDYLSAGDGEGGLAEGRNLSFSASLRGKRGRFSLKLSCPDLPPDPLNWAVSLQDAWELSLSWRREWR